MTNNIIVGIGEALWDILPEGRKIGGAPANFAYHVSQFGLESNIVSAVGKDEYGNEILKNFREKGLNYEIEKIDYPTGTVLVSLDEKGIPHYEIKENTAWDNIPFTPALENLAKHTQAVCFGTLAQRSPVSRTTINTFIDKIPDGENIYKIFDINLRLHYYDRDTIENALRKCNILKINDDEALLLSQMFGLDSPDLEKICRYLLSSYRLKIVILTCGTNGSYVYTQNKCSFLETPKIIVADTVGAGDSFTAAFCSSVILGKDIRTAHRIAVDVSAHVCTQKGAMPLIPEDLKKE